EWDVCLLVRLWTSKTFNREIFKSTVLSIWRLPIGAHCKDIRNNLLLFILNKKGDREWVIRREPWLFDKCLVVMQELNDEINPSHVVWETCSLRIRVFRLPLVCLSKQVGRLIGNSIGLTEDIECIKEKGNMGNFFRLRVKVSIKEPLRKGINLSCGCLGKVWLTFKHKKLPNLCYVFGYLGHME
ncbi:DUF4283 domain-containing protein, partial [Cephalotus follicularis]